MAAYRYYQGVYERKQSNKKKSALTRHEGGKKEKRKEKEKEPCAKPHPPYHRPTYCDPTARMNGASRSGWPMEVTKCGLYGT